MEKSNGKQKQKQKKPKPQKQEQGKKQGMSKAQKKNKNKAAKRLGPKKGIRPFNAPPPPCPLDPHLRVSTRFTSSDAIASALHLRVPSTEEQSEYVSLLALLRRKVESEIPGAIVTPYGSCTTGLLVRGSDLDCDIKIPSGRNVVGCMNRLYQSFLTEKPNIKREQNLTHTRIPVIKLSARVGTQYIGVDLCFNNEGALTSSNFVRYCVGLHPRVRPLIMALKLWAKEHDINDAFKNTLSSYALFLLVLHFMIVEIGALPPIIEIIDGFVAANQMPLTEIVIVPPPIVKSQVVSDQSNSKEGEEGKGGQEEGRGLKREADGGEGEPISKKPKIEKKEPRLPNCICPSELEESGPARLAGAAFLDDGVGNVPEIHELFYRFLHFYAPNDTFNFAVNPGNAGKRSKTKRSFTDPHGYAKSEEIVMEINDPLTGNNATRSVNKAGLRRITDAIRGTRDALK